MRYVFFVLLFLIIVACFTELNAEELFLKKLLIKGNRFTKENYIRSFITLEEGKNYELDAIIDEINISRKNLEETDLFSDIFFDDHLDNDNDLVLTVRLKEKNYLLFGPTGFITYDDEIMMNTGLFIAYKNLFGNGGSLDIEIPLYEYTRVVISYDNVIRRLRYTWESEYQYSFKDESNYFAITPGFGYMVFKDFFTGFNFSLNRYIDLRRSDLNSLTSLIFLPYIEGGTTQRFSFKTKKWIFYKISPFYGINVEASSFYGINIEMNIYRDLLLKIVYTLIVTTSFQDGEIPQTPLSLDFYCLMYDRIVEFPLKARVRGTYPYDYTGNKRISITNELHISLPWNNRITIVPFLDTNIIGYKTLDLLFGGGVGFHWYTKFQDPLVMEIAFGKAIMLNFQKKF